MRILVVEDEPGIATALERGLTADGFTVDVTDNGMDGLHLAQTNPYAAIVLDNHVARHERLQGLSGTSPRRELDPDRDAYSGALRLPKCQADLRQVLNR